MYISKIKVSLAFVGWLQFFSLSNSPALEDEQKKSFGADDREFIFPDESEELIISPERDNSLLNGTEHHPKLGTEEMSELIAKGKGLLYNLLMGNPITIQSRTVFVKYEEYNDRFKVPGYTYKDPNTPPPPNTSLQDPPEPSWNLPSLNPLGYLPNPFSSSSPPQCAPSTESNSSDLAIFSDSSVIQPFSENLTESSNGSKSEHRRNYLEQIISIIWALYAQAEETNQSFQQGAFVLEDKHQQIYSFFHHYAYEASQTAYDQSLPFISTLGCYNLAYNRMGQSTHFVGRCLTHFGIDIRAERLGLTLGILPYQMRHILVGRVQTFTGQILTFIKAEPYGFGDNRDLVGHTFHYVVGKLESTFPILRRSGLTSTDSTEYLTSNQYNIFSKRREKDIPSRVAREFGELLNILAEPRSPMSRLFKEEVHQNLRKKLEKFVTEWVQSSQKDSFIKQFENTETIDIAFMYLVAQSLSNIAHIAPLLQQQISKLMKELISFYEEDTLHLRTGNEVLFKDCNLI